MSVKGGITTTGQSRRNDCVSPTITRNVPNHFNARLLAVPARPERMYVER